VKSKIKHLNKTPQKIYISKLKQGLKRRWEEIMFQFNIKFKKKKSKEMGMVIYL
jgi:hypothetical protein